MDCILLTSELQDESPDSSESEASTGVVQSPPSSGALATPVTAVENEYTKSLEMLQRIQEITGGGLIDVPQICVAGDQSSGKSSLLRSLTGVPFPENSGICTKVAARVQCRQDKGRNAVVFEIKDPDSDKWDLTPVDAVSKKILKVQKSLLAQKKEKPAKICTDREVNVRVTGPNLMDIIVNDLPGLIHTGPERAETHALIRKYVERERTLILLVSEAQRDDETVAAIELAKEVDPDCKRTMRVLTKFDSFDSKESKATAVKLIGSQEPMHLGAHAVACRVNGKSDYDSAAEMEPLHALSLPPQRTGIESLKGRLPKVFAELIRSNLPGMLESVIRSRREAWEQLQAIGSTSINGHLMIQKFCQASLEACDAVEEQLTVPLRRLQECVHKSERLIAQEYVEKHFTENVFQIPFFQGGAPFKKCWHLVIEEWQHILMQYVQVAESVMDKSLTDLDFRRGSGVSHRLCRAAEALWKQFCKDTLFPEFRESCEGVLCKECSFGTVNHYLIDSFAQEMVLPESLMNDFVNTINAEHDSLHAKTDATNTTFMKSKMKEKLTEARDRWAKKHASQSLHEHQQHRVLAVLKANWTVEKKTFTDLVYKESMRILARRRLWIQSELQSNEDILKSAVEDGDTAQKREDLKFVISKLSSCEAEIQKNM